MLARHSRVCGENHTKSPISTSYYCYSVRGFAPLDLCYNLAQHRHTYLPIQPFLACVSPQGFVLQSNTMMKSWNPIYQKKISYVMYDIFWWR